MLYVGTLAIGTALTNTGAGDLIGSQISNLLGDTPNNYLIGLVFFLVPFLLTQVMVNNAVANVFIPIAILTCKTMGCNPVGPIMLVMSGATTAFLTPLATVAASMMMGCTLEHIAAAPSARVNWVAAQSGMAPARLMEQLPEKEEKPDVDASWFN